MRSQCARQLVVSSVALLAWVAVVWLMLIPPGPDDTLRLPFFAVLGVAIGSTSLAVLPWLLAGYIHAQVLAWIAGYMHREADGQRPDLRLVQGGGS